MIKCFPPYFTFTFHLKKLRHQNGYQDLTLLPVPDIKIWFRMVKISNSTTEGTLFTEDREGDYSLSREIFVESFTTVDTIREEYSRY